MWAIQKCESAHVMATDLERKTAWEAMLTATYNRLYWQTLAGRYHAQDTMLQIVLAVLASSAFVTLLKDLDTPIVARALSVITAALAVMHPLLKLGQSATQMAALASSWHNLEIGYDASWRETEGGKFPEKKFQQLREREAALTGKAAKLPTGKKRLHEECFEQALRMKGLS